MSNLHPGGSFSHLAPPGTTNRKKGGGLQQDCGITAGMRDYINVRCYLCAPPFLLVPWSFLLVPWGVLFAPRPPQAQQMLKKGLQQDCGITAGIQDYLMPDAIYLSPPPPFGTPGLRFGTLELPFGTLGIPFRT